MMRRNIKSGSLDFFSNMFFLTFVFIIIFIGLIIAAAHKKNTMKDLVEEHVSNIDVDYNMLNLLRLTDETGYSGADTVRYFCKRGDTQYLDTFLDTNLKKIIPNSYKYKIEIDDSVCVDKYERVIKKGEIKEKSLFGDKCNEDYTGNVILPNFDTKTILINVYTFRCDDEK